MNKLATCFFTAVLFSIVFSSCQIQKTADLSQSIQESESGDIELLREELSESDKGIGKIPDEANITYEKCSDIHTITQSIVDDGIPLIFRFTTNYEAPIDIEDKFAFGIVTEYHAILDILDKTGTLLQSISFDAFSQFGLGYYQETVFNDCITDINFDGYRDILILGSVGGAKANHYYLGWVYNPQTNQFDKVNIGAITNLVVDRKNKVLKSVVANWAASHTYSIYRYIDGKFTLTNSVTAESLTENGSENYYYIEVELINGEMVEVSRLIKLPENSDELASRYGEGTIWNDFYDSDYGAERNE